MTADIDTMVSIAHSFLGSDAFDFSCEEIPSVVMLAVARERLAGDGDRPDTRGEKGREEWASFLKLAEKAAVALNLDSYPREYRSKFSADLQSMFSETERSYRVDILEAALTFTPTLMVNGVAYQLSETVVDHSKALREMWLDLGELLDQWGSPDRALGQARAELCARLLRLDVAWAEFEEAYVEGLSLAQQRARGALAQAVLRDRRLKSAVVEPARPVVEPVVKLGRRRGARRGARHPDIGPDGGLLASGGSLLSFDAAVEPMKN
jgi:hypothetical protein